MAAAGLCTTRPCRPSRGATRRKDMTPISCNHNCLGILLRRLMLQSRPTPESAFAPPVYAAHVGFVMRVAEDMVASDVLIIKAWPRTIAEAVSVSLPFLQLCQRPTCQDKRRACRLLSSRMNSVITFPIPIWRGWRGQGVCHLVEEGDILEDTSQRTTHEPMGDSGGRATCRRRTLHGLSVGVSIGGRKLDEER